MLNKDIPLSFLRSWVFKQSVCNVEQLKDLYIHTRSTTSRNASTSIFSAQNFGKGHMQMCLQAYVHLLEMSTFPFTTILLWLSLCLFLHRSYNVSFMSHLYSFACAFSNFPSFWSLFYSVSVQCGPRARMARAFALSHCLEMQIWIYD